MDPRQAGDEPRCDAAEGDEVTRPDSFYRTHVRSRHATNTRLIALVDAVSLIVILAFLVVALPILWGRP